VAALILLPTLSFGAGGDVEGCIPWENQIENRIKIPTRHALIAKTSSILKSMANIYTLSLFPVIGMSCWFIIFLIFTRFTKRLSKNDARCPSLCHLTIIFLKYVEKPLLQKYTVFYCTSRAVIFDTMKNIDQEYLCNI
jgi:hypothetical protein